METYARPCVNREPAGVWGMTQGTHTGVLWQPAGVGWGERWEQDSRGSRICTYGWFMLMFGKKQNNTCKALILWLKINKNIRGKKKLIWTASKLNIWMYSFFSLEYVHHKGLWYIMSKSLPGVMDAWTILTEGHYVRTSNCFTRLSCHLALLLHLRAADKPLS